MAQEEVPNWMISRNLVGYNPSLVGPCKRFWPWDCPSQQNSLKLVSTGNYYFCKIFDWKEDWMLHQDNEGYFSKKIGSEIVWKEKNQCVWLSSHNHCLLQLYGLFYTTVCIPRSIPIMICFGIHNCQLIKQEDVGLGKQNPFYGSKFDK